MKVTLILSLLMCAQIFAKEFKTLAEEMGYPSGTKLLILNADDHGMSHGTNVGVWDVLDNGYATSATIMIPPSWSLEALKEANEKERANMGVHVTLTSEFSDYRWRPLTKGKSLREKKNGFFWETSEQVEKNVKLRQVRKEVRAQIKTAQRYVELSHFDSHMGALYGIYTGRITLLIHALAISFETGLPYRVPFIKETEILKKIGYPLLDYLYLDAHREAPKDSYENMRDFYLNKIRNLPEGVSELYFHPAMAGEEMKNITATWRIRDWERQFLKDPKLKQVIDEAGIQLIDYNIIKKYWRKKIKWSKWNKASDFLRLYRRFKFSGGKTNTL
jgi:predicted glycoside hydrolase/deacetylase ChbG (UPF0249 family)